MQVTYSAQPKKVRGLPTPHPSHIDEESKHLVDDGVHPLLEKKTINFSASVMQRAVLAWIHLGKRNDFKNVCMYYHRLEEVEETFSPEGRHRSRMIEFELMKHNPPLTAYFEKNFVSAYPDFQRGLPSPMSNEIWSPNATNYDEQASAILASVLGVGNTNKNNNNNNNNKK